MPLPHPHAHPFLVGTEIRRKPFCGEKGSGDSEQLTIISTTMILRNSSENDIGCVVKAAF